MKKVVIVFMTFAILLIGGHVYADGIAKNEDEVRALTYYKEFLEETISKKKEYIQYITDEYSVKPDAIHLKEGIAKHKKELAKFETKLKNINIELESYQ